MFAWAAEPASSGGGDGGLVTGDDRGLSCGEAGDRGKALSVGKHKRVIE